MANKDSVSKTLLVAVSLCIVCSVVVSTAAVLLKPSQTANKALDYKRNILSAAGMLEPGVSVEEQFKRVEPRIVKLDEGRFSDELDPEKFDQRQASKDPQLSDALSADEDIAKILRRVKYAEVYLVRNDNGELNKIVLPVKGYGLWSTMYGFLALENDFNTVAGLGFYEHAETPGLGGEIDNPRWKSLWHGKAIYSSSGDVAISVIKGAVDSSTPNAQYKVDGLSGATLTSRGVGNMMQFWFGEQGFKPFLNNLRRGEA